MVSVVFQVIGKIIWSILKYSVRILNLNDFMQIKRCGEMARRLRFFKEQMKKAGLSPSARSTTGNDIDLDDLEVVFSGVDLRS